MLAKFRARPGHKSEVLGKFEQEQKQLRVIVSKGKADKTVFEGSEVEEIGKDKKGQQEELRLHEEGQQAKKKKLNKLEDVLNKQKEE